MSNFARISKFVLINHVFVYMDVKEIFKLSAVCRHFYTQSHDFSVFKINEIRLNKFNR
jgi:hypothetical protein